jgi:hypothetical protein
MNHKGTKDTKKEIMDGCGGSIDSYNSCLIFVFFVDFVVK